jgi:hypothetical protein
MLAKATLSLIVLHTCLVVPRAWGSPLPDDLSAKLNKPVTDYNLGICNFVAGLVRVSTDFQIPMGIVSVNTPQARAELPFAWKDTTVQEIVEALAKSQAGYQVKRRNGVVHVFPSEVIPGSQNFLKSKIENFEVRNDFIEMASFKLHTLVTPLSGSRSISIGASGDSKVDLKLKNSSVEDILDALAISSNRKIWLVTFSEDVGLTPKGLRRTASLWTDKAIPDAQQPVWELMRWGDPAPPALAIKKGTSAIH